MITLRLHQHIQPLNLQLRRGIFLICEILKVGFFKNVMAKFSKLSNRHACEPKIVSELLFPVNVINTFMGNILTHLAKKSAYYES